MNTLQESHIEPFVIHDVEPASSPLPTKAGIEIFGRALSDNTKLIAASMENEPLVDHYYNDGLSQNNMTNGPGNPLLAAIHMAFSSHRPLRLDPDSLWLTIVQGVAAHQNVLDAARTEPLTNLEVQTLAYDPGQWGSYLQQLSELVIDLEHNAKFFQPEFSTTTQPDRIAAAICLCNAYQLRYSYSVRCICGIPKLTLDGKPEDWAKLLSQATVLIPASLDWWKSKLLPILRQFVQAAMGNIDRDFWRKMYQPTQTYGSEVLSGWALHLFPYLCTADYRTQYGKGNISEPKIRNPLLVGWSKEYEKPKLDWVFEDGKFRNDIPPDGCPVAGLWPGTIPKGISTMQVNLIDRMGKISNYIALGGLVGVTQSGLELSPVTGWGVVEIT